MKIENIKVIGIIGAGLMGHGLAQIFAGKGFRVNLYDIKQEFLEKALEGVRSNLTMMAEKGLGKKSDIEPLISRIQTTTDINMPALGSQFIIEAVPEIMKLKQDIFAQLDKIAPVDTILATNTSVMSITEIASKASHRERIVGTHFWNPPFLIPLVEVVKGNDTSLETLEITYQLLQKAGKHPVKVMKDVPGFIGNRLQHALWREAFAIVQNGIADAKTVDEAIKNSFGIRLAVLGPMENADMVGLDMTVSIHDYILKNLDNSTGAQSILKEKVQRGELGFKSGKGFLEWPQAEINKSRNNLLEYLIEYTKQKEKGQS